MKLEFDLLENGFDFILSAIKMINDNSDKNSTKYALLNLSSGIELVFKERLKNEHWSLLFEDVNKANKKILASGDFKSVNSMTVRARLEEICEIDLKEIDPKNHLNNLRLKRNKIEHFAIKENIESLKGLLANVLFAIIKFIDDELEESKFSDQQLSLFSRIKTHSIKFEQYANIRLKFIEPEVEVWAYVFDCPDCFYETMAIANDGLECLFCGSLPDPEFMAQEWGDSQLKCPKCNCYAITQYDGEQVCLNCGESYNDLRNCEECGETFRPQYEEIDYMCSSCLSNKFDDYDDNFFAH